ncbi:MAG: alanine racemase [Syntrophomonadaceae bacterium]|nr:alanine racemase [Syntrophomonadaceae bacterium]
MDNRRPTWAEIDLGVIRHNICSVREAAAGAKVMAVVKANGYGHGMLEVSRICLEEGIGYLAVASLDEAMILREAGINLPVLVLGYIPEEYADTVVENNIRTTIFNSHLAKALSRAAVKLSKEAYLHIKIDTGMGRLGFLPDEKALNMIGEIASLPGVKLEGIFTHFAVADIQDRSFTLEQFRIFKQFISRLEQRNLYIPIKHCSNSAAFVEYPETHLDMVRAGIILYGLYPSSEIDRNKLDIIPAMTFKSRISFIKNLPAGYTISYGRTYCCADQTKVATVPVGYADGYSRLLSNRARAVIKGQEVPLIGNVCMDQCMFDVSGVEGVKEGDDVILFGRPEHGVTVDNLAEIMGTINYEVLCSITSRVPRIYI